MKGMDEVTQKRLFLAMLYNRNGNIGRTCRDIQVSRYMWRKWIEKDEEFAEKCADVEESLIDLGVGALIENVKKGKSADIQFLLKTLGRDRGFGEKVQFEHTGIIAHAHGIKHFPPEPKDLAEWERQVKEAEKAEKELPEGQNALPEGSNQAVESAMPADPPCTTA